MRLWVLRLWVSGSLLVSLATGARAASVVLAGPPVIHVGDTASYTVEVALSPGELISYYSEQFTLENARDLIGVLSPGVAEPHFQYGWIGQAWVLDAVQSYDSFHFQTQPVVLWATGGEPTSCTAHGPPGSCPDPNAPDEPLPPYTADQGPFVVMYFDLTAVAPGVLRFTDVPPGPILAPGYYDHSPNGVHAGYDPNDPFYPTLPGADGAYATITIVPEPSLPALLLLAALALGVMGDPSGIRAAAGPACGDTLAWRKAHQAR